MNKEDWASSCHIEVLQCRAKLLSGIRKFFDVRGVLEVETPLLSANIGTDPNLNFFSSEFSFPPIQRQMYLQTSPEFAMKRLLASGSGSIFQICKAFRNGECGRFHNPEFTLLEWYRIDFDLPQLMDEIEALWRFLLGDILNIETTIKISYVEIFNKHTGLEALQFSLSDYRACAKQRNLPDAERICGEEHELWLDFLFSEIVQPAMMPESLYLVFHYPACMPSLARSNQNNKLVERVELFFNGYELGNGYHELTDPDEQALRFENDIMFRQKNALPPVKCDQRLLAALYAGLPDCAGMAIGLDRVLMLAMKASEISDVLTFSIDNA